VTQQTRSPVGAAIIGGLAGAVASALLILFGAPHLAGSRIVREGLRDDPQILVEASDALRDLQYAPVLAKHRRALETPFATSWKGAAKPDVTLVEFFDYACSYCRASLPHIERLLDEDKNLRVVYRELPILGPESVTAARLSLAASKAGRFEPYHDALYAAGRPAENTIAEAAGAAGIPAAVPDDPQIEAELKRNFDMAGQLGLTGTPMFVVGDRVLNGAVGYDALKAAIAAAREKGPTS
jgi:protein-disulfide isomerase